MRDVSNMTNMGTPQHTHLFPGGQEIYNFGRFSLVIITAHLIFAIYAQKYRIRFFKK